MTIWAVADDARPRPIDWIVTIPFLIAFGGTLVVYEVVLRIARRLGRQSYDFAAACLQWTMIQVCRVAGASVRVERSPRVRPNTSYLFLSNHQSMFDIVLIGGLLFTNHPRFVSKRELARRIPSVSYHLRTGGHALIDRGDRAQATRAIEALGRRVASESTYSAALFPEGTRARRGELGAFRPAGASSLLGAAPGVPIVPIAIDESWRLLRYNMFPVPFGVGIRVWIGDPIERQAGEDPKALLDDVRSQIAKKLADWRSPG